jgi:hypothetical protein
MKNKLSSYFFKKKEVEGESWKRLCINETPGQSELPEYWKELNASDKEKWIGEFMDGYAAKKHFKTTV